MNVTNDKTNQGSALIKAGLFLAALVLGVVLAQFLPTDLFGLRPESALSEASRSQASGSADDGQLWTCGMHPHVIEDEPGQCPICGMDLTPMRGSGTSSEEAHGDPASSVSQQWTCPDHSSIVEAEPGTCPIDGLDLVAVAADPRPAEDLMDGHATGSTSGSTSGATIVKIDPTTIQNMNVRTEVVERRDLTQSIRTVGYLDYDQQRMVTVTTKYSGWVEKVYVNYVGEKVRRGQPLFEIYSPELVQTQQELMSAIDFARELSEAPEDAVQRALSMVDSARTRLSYWDISPQQISDLEKTGKVFRTLKVSAPAGGMVMKRMPGLEGMAVKPGMELFHIADLSSLWLTVELFEGQLAQVGEGGVAEIDLSYFPGESFSGRVRYLEPELSEKTRTMRARIEVPNPRGRLRKGMFATVEFQPLVVPNAVAVPTAAVIRTGQRNVVVSALGGGRFAPHDVTLGHETGGFVEVLAGLEVGDVVVTSAQFLLDSESKLRQAIQSLIAEREGQSATPSAATSAIIDNGAAAMPHGNH